MRALLAGALALALACALPCAAQDAGAEATPAAPAVPAEESSPTAGTDAAPPQAPEPPPPSPPDTPAPAESVELPGDDATAPGEESVAPPPPPTPLGTQPPAPGDSPEAPDSPPPAEGIVAPPAEVEDAAPAAKERRPVVSTETQRRRDDAVRQSLERLTPAPEAKPLTETERLAVVASLARQARMQLYSFQTERSGYEEQRDAAVELAREVREQASRLPPLLRSGKLPVLYADEARKRAEETVAELNDAFDVALQRRADLSEALAQYRRDLSAAKKAAGGLGGGDVAVAMAAAVDVLEERVLVVGELIELLDEVMARTVELSEAAAGLSLTLSENARWARSHGLLARTAEPLNLTSPAAIATELLRLREDLTNEVLATQRATSAQSAAARGVWSLAILALFALLCWCVGRLPGRQPPDTSSPRIARAARLLTPAGRALLLMGAAWVLIHLWDLPDHWATAAVSLLAAWAGYFVLHYILCELLAPRQSEHRILQMRSEAAINLYALLRALALYAAALFPVLVVLGGLDDPPKETLRLLQVLGGVGLLVIGVWLTRRSGGLLAILPAPETPRKTALQHAGRLVAPVCALGVLGGVLAAAGGYSNLAAYMNRKLAWELLLLIASVFVYHLILKDDDDESQEAWRRWAHPAFGAAILLLQIPIWGLRTYHATIAYGLLATPMITVQGAEVSAASILRGALLVLAGYLCARVARSRMQSWGYLANRVEAGVRYALSSLAFYLILTAGVLWGILASGFQLSVLTVFAGMAGIGLGFGLQDIVSNFFSGLILLIERPVAVGDFVDLGDLRGWITAINLRSTTIRDRENNVVLVPNSDLAASRVTNLTLSDPTVRVTVSVGVSYDSDMKLVREILMGIARENKLVLTDPEPRALLMDFGSSSVDFDLWVWVTDASSLITVADQLRTSVWDAFAEHDIEIPFPQTDLHVRSSDIPFPDNPPHSAYGSSSEGENSDIGPE